MGARNSFFEWVRLAVILFLLTIASARADNIDRFIVVVPIFRELYSQNIGLLLRSLYAQDLEGLSFSKIDVYFVVNHTVAAKPEAKTENIETVNFLNELAAGRVPKVRDEHLILKEVASKPLTNKINIRVVDLTSPGLKERNIGNVRDIGVKEVLKSVSEGELKHTLIAQMDGDTQVTSGYVRNATAAFLVENEVEFTLNTLYYGDEPDAVARVYQRKITTDFNTAAYQFNLINDNDMPYGGGPRIVARAEAMKTVDGVPHEIYAEDCKLIEKLKAKYPAGGRFIDNPVFANYRAREDSYDGRDYLKSLNRPIEFGDYEVNTVPVMEKVVAEFAKDAALDAFYNETLELLNQEYLRSARRLKSLIGIMIDEVHSGVQIVSMGAGYPALLNNTWFANSLNAKIKKFGYDHEKILSEFTQEFPYYLSEPPAKVTQNISRLRAATETLLMKPYLKAATKVKKSYASVLSDRVPKFVKDFQIPALYRPPNIKDFISKMPDPKRTSDWRMTQWLDELFKLNPSLENLRTVENKANNFVVSRYLREQAYRFSETAEDFVAISGPAFDNGSERYRNMIDRIIEENIGRFIALKPTDEQIIALARKLQFPDDRGDVLRRLLEAAQNKTQVRYDLAENGCEVRLHVQY